MAQQSDRPAESRYGDGAAHGIHHQRDAGILDQSGDTAIPHRTEPARTGDRQAVWADGEGNLMSQANLRRTCRWFVSHPDRLRRVTDQVESLYHAAMPSFRWIGSAAAFDYWSDPSRQLTDSELMALGRGVAEKLGLTHRCKS